MSRRAGAAAVGIMAALVASACGPAASTAEVDAPTSASAVVDGVAVHLTVDRSRLASGGSLEANVTVRHLGRDPIRWRAGGCELRGSVTVRSVGAVAEADPGGSDDPAAADDARRVERFIAAVAAAGDAVIPVRTVGGATTGLAASCRLDHGFAALAPGDSLEERVSWPATTVAGAPLPAGSYEVVASFPALAAEARLVPAEFEASRDVRPIAAGVALDVVGPGAPVSGAAALRALIAATALDGWIRAGSVTPVDTSMAFDGARWSVEVRLPTGGRAVGHVSADGREVSALAVVP
jgi:hypothetical protein